MMEAWGRFCIPAKAANVIPFAARLDASRLRVRLSLKHGRDWDIPARHRPVVVSELFTTHPSRRCLLMFLPDELNGHNRATAS